MDLKDCDYLSFPSLNQKESVAYYCENCDTDYEFDITLEMDVIVHDGLRKV